ncbi:MAG TPA: hypothetical protein VH280_19530 [Verrucomicrobiae bacterium]|nr:hypothetical protein [Verrucomicrobiae bacterium]
MSATALAQQAATIQPTTVQPVAPVVESTSQLAMTNSYQIFPRHAPPSASQPYEPFKWDQFVLRPHADYQYVDAYHILAAPSNIVNSTIQRISPGFLLNLGPHWALDYTLTIALYSNTNFGTEVDHSITLTGQTTYGDWDFGFMQGVILSSTALIEFGGQASSDYYNTSVTGHHENNQYFTEDVSLNQNFQIYPGGYDDTRSWSTINWLNYQPQSHFSIGIGPGLGYNNSVYGPDSVFEQLEARINWRLNDVFSIQVAAGFSETEFLGAGANGDLFSPIYSGSLQFKPFSQTELSVFASRSVSPSPFFGQYTETTSEGASLSQRFLKQFYVSADAAYTDQKYVASSFYVLVPISTNQVQLVLISPGRTDKFYTFTARLSHSFLQRGSVSIFYAYSDNRSTQGGYSFSSNQFGGEASYSF